MPIPLNRGGELFNPPGVTWNPVSPKLATARLIILAICFVPCIAAGVVAALVTDIAWLYLPTGLLLVIALWLTWLIVRGVKATGYAEQADDLLVRGGIMFLRLSLVPYGRMQFVDVNMGPLDRALKLAKVTMRTAAAGLTVTVPGLPPEEAARLRDQLASLGQANQAGL
ncbi:MAG: PH domain-containing protein [Bifidobacteriaceae bacterium]|jgi:membrane protein YdbS with pleckstrin-like domain|nr:PH domain-containing protein [Bifidobacteriaceae bacterium]